MENLEMQEYKRQLCQRPHMITTTSLNEPSKSSDKRKNPTSYQTRVAKYNTCVMRQVRQISKTVK